MAWDVAWFDQEQTIVYAEPGQSWHWNEFADAVEQTQHLVRSKEYAVYVIYNLGPDFQTPATNFVGSTRRAGMGDGSKNELTYIIGANGFFQALFSVLNRAMGGSDKFRDARSVDEALRLIYAARQTRH
jgi:hypothetical protein